MTHTVPPSARLQTVTSAEAGLPVGSIDERLLVVFVDHFSMEIYGSGAITRVVRLTEEDPRPPSSLLLQGVKASRRYSGLIVLDNRRMLSIRWGDLEWPRPDDRKGLRPR